MEKKKKRFPSEESTTSIKVTKKARDILNRARGEQTIIQYMEEVTESIELMLSGKPICIVGGKAFTNLLEARGEAVMQSAMSGEPYNPPALAIIVAKDKPL